MATTNPITGDAIQSKTYSQEGLDNFDKIFGPRPVKKPYVYEENVAKPIDESPKS